MLDPQYCEMFVKTKMKDFRPVVNHCLRAKLKLTLKNPTDKDRNLELYGKSENCVTFSMLKEPLKLLDLA